MLASRSERMLRASLVIPSLLHHRPLQMSSSFYTVKKSCFALLKHNAVNVVFLVRQLNDNLIEGEPYNHLSRSKYKDDIKFKVYVENPGTGSKNPTL